MDSHRQGVMSQDQRAPGPHGCSIWHCPGTLMGAQSVPTPASEPRAFRGTSRGLGHVAPVTWRETPKLLKVPSTPDQGERGPGMTGQRGGRSTAGPRASEHQRLPWCRVNQTQELGQLSSRGVQPGGICRQNARVEAGKGPAWVLACSLSCCRGHGPCLRCLIWEGGQ